MKSIKKIFTNVTKKQCGEFGLVAILITLILALYFRNNNYVIVAVVFTLLTLIVPVIFYPFAVFWFGLSTILGAISSRVLMTIIFFLVVVPVGWIRKLSGNDSLKLRQFRKSVESVMIKRDHEYTKTDLENTF